MLITTLGKETIGVTEAALRSARRGAETLLIRQDDMRTNAQPPDVPLMKAIARGHRWFTALASGQFKSIGELAMQEGVTDRYVSRQIAFAFIAPELVEAFVIGQRRFATLSIEDLRGRQLPLSWPRQWDLALGRADLQTQSLRKRRPANKGKLPGSLA